jgi:hypothetical protein
MIVRQLLLLLKRVILTSGDRINMLSAKLTVQILGLRIMKKRTVCILLIVVVTVLISLRTQIDYCIYTSKYRVQYYILGITVSDQKFEW